MFRQTALIIFLATILGAVRQFAPNGLHWIGKWPTASTSAKEAYGLMARPGDPPFLSLAEAIGAESKKNGIILDARDKNLFKEGHIPGALNLPFYEYDTEASKVLKSVDPQTLMIVYCEGINCELSFFLGRQLEKDGYKNVKIFYGGYPEWKNAGLPIEKG